MLSSQTPVPSKSALRFLRSVAYAGSVLSFGGVALIAEERRRHIQLAQKVLEQRRRIHATPQYTAAASRRKRGADLLEELYGRLQSREAGQEAPQEEDAVALSAFTKGPEDAELRSDDSAQGCRTSVAPPPRFSRQDDQRMTPGPGIPSQDLPRFTRIGPTAHATSALGRIDRHNASSSPNLAMPDHDHRRVVGSVERDRVAIACHRMLDADDIEEASALFLSTFLSSDVTTTKNRAYDSTLRSASSPWPTAVTMLALRLLRRTHRTGLAHRRQAIIDWLLSFDELRPRTAIGTESSATYAFSTIETDAVLVAAPLEEAILWLRNLPTAELLSPRRFAAFLRRVWSESRNLITVKKLFEDLKAFLVTSTDTPRIFGTMIEICAIAGQPWQARLYLNEAEANKISSSSPCMHEALAVTQAFEHDWSGVLRTMGKMKDLGLLKKERKSTRWQFMNHVLAEFSRQHTPEKLLCFLTDLVDTFGFTPGCAAMRAICQAAVSQSKPQLISRWVKFLESRALPVPARGSYVRKVLHEYFTRHRPSVNATWKLLGRLKADTSGSASRKLLTTAKSSLSWNARHGTTTADQKRFIGMILPKMLSSEKESGDLDSLRGSQTTLTDMRLAIDRGLPAEALRIYEKFTAETQLASPNMLAVAAEASVKLHGGAEAEAFAMITEAADNGLEVRKAAGVLLMHRLRNLDHDDSHGALDRILRFYETLDKKGIPVTHHAVTGYVAEIAKRGRTHDVVRVLSGISNSKWGESLSLNIVAQSILVHAYGWLSDVRGIQNVIQTILDRNVRVDRQFLTALKQAISSLRYRARADHRDISRGFSGTAQPLEVWQTRIRFVRHLAKLCAARSEQQRSDVDALGEDIASSIEEIASLDANKNHTSPLPVGSERSEARPRERHDSWRTPSSPEDVNNARKRNVVNVTELKHRQRRLRHENQRDPRDPLPGYAHEGPMLAAAAA